MAEWPAPLFPRMAFCDSRQHTLLIAIRLLLIRPTWVIPPEIGLEFVGQFVGGVFPRSGARAWVSAPSK